MSKKKFFFNPINLDIIICFSFFMTAVSCFIFTRYFQNFYIPFSFLVILSLIYNYKKTVSFKNISPFSVSIIVFLIWSFCSVLWTIDKHDAILRLAFASMTIFCSHGLFLWVQILNAQKNDLLIKILSVTYILSISIIIIFFAIKLTLPEKINQFLTEYKFIHTYNLAHAKKVFNGYVRYEPLVLNINVFSINLFMWVMLLNIKYYFNGIKNYLFSTLLFVSVIYTTFFSDHESSKLGLLFSSMYFLFFKWKANLGYFLFILIWTIIVFFPIPISNALYSNFKLHEVSWLQPSAKERITIWKEYSERTKETLIVGSGVRNARALSKLETPATYDILGKGSVFVHPHNVYLQVQNELGIIGSLSFFIIGLTLLISIKNCPKETQASMSAMFLFVIVTFGLCWDLWADWYITILSFSFLTMLLSANRYKLNYIQSSI